MPSNFTRIYIHHIWSTWDRQPMLIPVVRDAAYKVIREECKFLKCEIIRRPDFLFKWQGSYGALTVSKSGVDDLCEYIDGQEEHHRRKSLIPDWEPI